MAWADLFAAIGGGLEGFAGGLQYEQQRKDRERQLAQQAERQRIEDERYNAEIARREAAKRREDNLQGLRFMKEDRAAWEGEQLGKQRKAFRDTLPPHLQTIIDAESFGINLRPNDLIDPREKAAADAAAAKRKRDEAFEDFTQRALFSKELNPREPKSNFNERATRYRLYVDAFDRAHPRSSNPLLNDPNAPKPLTFEEWEAAQRQPQGGATSAVPNILDEITPRGTARAPSSPRQNEPQIAKEADALIAQIEQFKRAGRLEDARRAQERLRALIGGR